MIHHFFFKAHITYYIQEQKKIIILHPGTKIKKEPLTLTKQKDDTIGFSYVNSKADMLYFSESMVEKLALSCRYHNLKRLSLRNE